MLIAKQNIKSYPERLGLASQAFVKRAEANLFMQNSTEAFKPRVGLCQNETWTQTPKP